MPLQVAPFSLGVWHCMSTGWTRSGTATLSIRPTPRASCGGPLSTFGPFGCVRARLAVCWKESASSTKGSTTSFSTSAASSTTTDATTFAAT